MSDLVQKDLSVVIVHEEGSIQFKNFKELEQLVKNTLKQYEGIELNDDNKQDIKKIMADLNKVKKAINDERIRVEREYTKPLELLKDQVKSIVGTIDETRNTLDEQVKEDDRIKREEKTSLLKDYFDNNLPKEIDFITFEDVGLNVTLSASDTSLKKQIDEHIEKVQTDMEEITTDQNGQRLLGKYRLSKNLQQSRIELNRELQEEQKVVEELPQMPAVEPQVEQEEELTVTFTVTGTRTKIRAVREYMERLGLKYE